MDPDGYTFPKGPRSGDDFSNDPPTTDGFTMDPPAGHDFIVVTPPPVPVVFPYSPEDAAYIYSIQTEASRLFPAGKMYASRKQLREEVTQFADRKGFAVATDGNKICCSRCEESQSARKKRERKNASGIVPEKRRRTYRSSSRCGCPFKIAFSWVDLKDKTNKSIRLNGSSNFQHDNGCRPSQDQLIAAKRKAGTYTKAVNESKIQKLLTLLKTNNKVSSATMRELVRPLFPPGHLIDSKLLNNLLIKAKKTLSRITAGEAFPTTITQEDGDDDDDDDNEDDDDEPILLNNTDLDDELLEYSTGEQLLFTQDDTISRTSTFDHDDDDEDDEYSVSNNVVEKEVPMKRGAPLLVDHSNHGKKRLKVMNHETFIKSSRQQTCCTLCCNVGHNAKETICPVVTKYQALFIDSKDVPELAASVGNPLYYEVKKPDSETKQSIMSWIEKGNLYDIPCHAHHLVLLNCYFCARENQPWYFNLVQVTVLEEGGKELSGYQIAFFPVYKIQEWLTKQCVRQGRNNKHVLSTLRPKHTSNHPFLPDDDMYNYSI
jgi:hypothetical protein